MQNELKQIIEKIDDLVQAGLPPPLLEVVVSHVLGWEDRAMSAAFRAVCTTWNAAHDALCSRLG